MLLFLSLAKRNEKNLNERRRNAKKGRLLKSIKEEANINENATEEETLQEAIKFIEELETLVQLKSKYSHA